MTTSSDTVLGTVVICAALDVEYLAVREHLDAPFTGDLGYAAGDVPGLMSVP